MQPAPPKWIWEPSPEWIRQTNVYRFMQRLGIPDRAQFIRFSQERLEEFWDEMAKEAGIHWLQPYERVLDTSDGVEWARWFIGGEKDNARHRLGPPPHRKHIPPLLAGDGGPPPAST